MKTKIISKILILMILLIVTINLSSAIVFLNSGSNNITISSLEKGLLAHWTMDNLDYNSNTNNLSSKTTTENSITNYGATFTTDRFGNTNSAMSFDGSTNYLKTTNNFVSNPTQLTISAWIKKESGGATFECALHKSTSYTIGASTYWLGIDSSDLLTATIGANTGVTGTWAAGQTTTTAIYGQWYHLVATWNGTLVKVYIDGEYNKQYALTTYTSVNAPTRIGASSDGANYEFKGDIDDVRIYNRALSADEVKSLYDSHKTKISGSSINKGLIGSWKLSESNYNNNTKQITDKSVYENHGTLYGGNLTTNHRGTTNNAMDLNTNLETLLVNYRTWEDGQTGAITNYFYVNGDTTENYRVIGTDPWGNDAVVWEARPDAVSGADGGFISYSFAVDKTKTYRFSTWVNRNVKGTDGAFYLGLNGYGTINGVVKLSDGTTQTNPYFWSTNNGLPEDEWILVVGHVYAYDHSGTANHADSGRYFVNGTKWGTITNDYKWTSGTTTARHRSYLFYTTDTSVRQQWIYPRVDIVDGTEPTIQELIDGFDSYGDNIMAELDSTPTSTTFWYKEDGDSTWTHVVNSSGTTYVNGETGSPTYYPITIYNNKIYIGRTDFSNYFTGAISNVNIYNRELTTTEIESLYQTT